MDEEDAISNCCCPSIWLFDVLAFSRRFFVRRRLRLVILFSISINLCEFVVLAELDRDLADADDEDIESAWSSESSESSSSSSSSSLPFLVSNGFSSFGTWLFDFSSSSSLFATSSFLIFLDFVESFTIFSSSPNSFRFSVDEAFFF